MAEKIEDFLVWHKSKAFWDAVDPILERPAFRKYSDLRNQIRDALDSITSNIEEGFEQSTDRGFARYLYTSKASAAEVCGRLALACKRKCVTPGELTSFEERGDEIQRMLTGLIRYLLKSNRKDRGIGKRSRSHTKVIDDKPKPPDNERHRDSPS